jgi:very-short-patch-repair endonuclease
MTHVMDADASQTIVIEEVKRGRNLVVQGPPGTGKSQTIANMIAAAVKEGKKVLFVAEKMAALDVVMRRLSNIGLGDMCLELHSHKANKRVIIKNLEKALNLTCQQPQDVERQAEELKEYRDKLNRHADVLHRQIEPANVTPYQVFGELVRLRSSGVKPADFKMDDVVTWTSTDLKEKENLLRDLEIHLREIGNPIEHCWRGVQLGAVLPMDIDRLMTSIPGIAGRLERLMTSTAELATLLHYGTANTAMDAATLAKFAKRLARAPVMDRQSIANDIWDIRRQEIDSLIETGKQLSQSQQYLQGTVAEVAWTTDVSKARLDLSAHGKSLFRIFIKDFRQAKATLRGILDVPPPKLLKERLNLLDVLMTGQRCVQVIGNDDAGQRVGKTAFGGKWNGVNSDWQALEKIAQWESKCRKEKTPDNFREVMAKVDDLTQIGELVGAMAVDFSPLIEELQQVFGQLELDLEVAFGDREYPTVSLALIKSRLEQWTNQPETINKWIAYHQRWKKLQECGLGPVAEKIAEGAMSAAEMIDRFQMSYFEDVIRKVFDESTDLAEFQGISHQEIVNRFIDLDQQRIELSRQEVRMGHDLGMPARSGKVGEVGVITREAAKKRRHLPLRKLMDQAGNAIQAIKPVFMMSPISVAQYLKPGDLEFDVLFFDEASQVRPAEALGAIARAKQLVVVGDEKQLPPTRFFSTTIGDEHEPDEDDLDLGDLESILGLCSAQRMPDRMLRWHYRSRHESLITVSNHSFYDNRLIIIPSPSDDDGKLGLKFRNLPHGTFDRGGSRTNRIEAQAIADAVMEHVRKYPDKTLGVGAFSVAQRDEILDELEVRRRNSPELEAFFATATEEPFFVKNLENIQGDERDVIFISIGYGKDSAGRMTMNFGPLNQQGGERRLNVLITRARERCEVFSSITADDIDLSRTRAQGTHALKVFLTFAEKGHLDVPVMSGKDYDSEFERQVDKAISSQGYEVQRQVGTAGFFIDLAVIDPDKPGRYLLGIECDGASYHSSLSARDRDRLRQQVLEDRGWLIHRIWSTDWFQRPEEQLRKTLAAIEEAKVTHAGRSGPSAPPTTPPPGDNLAERIEMSSPDGEKADKDDQENNDSDSVVQSNAIQTTPYVEANFRVNSSKEIHRVPRDVLTGIVVRVVEAEGPIHKDIVAKRVAKLWGLKQIGNRISKAVDLALKSACKKDRLEQDGCFFNLKGRLARVIRNRENVAQNQKKPEHLPPAEIEFAVLTVVREHVGVSFDEIVTTVARLFGSRSTSKQLKEVITKGTLALVHAGFLEQRNDKLYTNTNHISP